MLKSIFCLTTIALSLISAGRASAQSCGDGLIDESEECDDGNDAGGDGCNGACVVESSYRCVPTLFASGVSATGAPLGTGMNDLHWRWSTSSDGSSPRPGIVSRHFTWLDMPGVRWLTTHPDFGQSELPLESETYWFQTVHIPASMAGTLPMDIGLASDNEAEVFLNGVSYGSVTGYFEIGTVTIPEWAFLPGDNTISIRLREFFPGSPRGLLVFPAGGGILSQCSIACDGAADCDDGSSCTVDTCSAGACEHEAKPMGASCEPNGVCTEGGTSARCVRCMDTEGGSGIDLNCTSEAPICDTSSTPTCVMCIKDSDCDSGEVCASGRCREEDDMSSDPPPQVTMEAMDAGPMMQKESDEEDPPPPPGGDEVGMAAGSMEGDGGCCSTVGVTPSPSGVLGTLLIGFWLSRRRSRKA